MEAQLEARIANTFVDVVRQQADAHGDREAFAYIRDMSDGQINDTLSFRELDTQARIAAGWLTKQGARQATGYCCASRRAWTSSSASLAASMRA